MKFLRPERKFDSVEALQNQILLDGKEAHRAILGDMLPRNNGGYVNYIDYFPSLFEEWGWQDAPEVGDIYREFRFRFPDYVSLLPDAVPVLEELRRQGYKTGVITNGPSRLQHRKLDVSGLRPLLDIAVVSGDENAPGGRFIHKPDPRNFLPYRRPSRNRLFQLSVCEGSSG